jgi:transcriptional regulator with XRE-family HTH domain
MMGLRQNIHQKRKAQNMTLEELAQKVGTSKQTIQRYESGVIGNIPSDKIEKMANALDCTPADLMGWEDEKSEKNDFIENLDVSDEINNVLNKLMQQPEGLMFCGKPLDDETKRLLKMSLEHAMQLAIEMDKNKESE